MSVLDHAAWPELVPHLAVHDVGRDPRQSGTRFRLEVRHDTPPLTRQRLLRVVSPCVHCRTPMHPFRQRAGGTGIYFAATCEHGLTGACSKGRAARDEYAQVRAAIERCTPPTPPAVQGGLPW